MYDVQQHGRPANVRDATAIPYGIFYFDKFPFGGKEMTLDAVEKQKVRSVGDPRVHFALNCSSYSCPPLRKETYDGSKLEAHSGLGSLLDDPSHVDEKMHGATPPNVYNLELREELFHGVRALRLIPQDERNVFGRAGFLAHSFMLGPNGDSNGCVSIKNYDTFLQAYLDHKIKHLAVVASL
jgi:hypothetical protein